MSNPLENLPELLHVIQSLEKDILDMQQKIKQTRDEHRLIISSMVENLNKVEAERGNISKEYHKILFECRPRTITHNLGTGRRGGYRPGAGRKKGSKNGVRQLTPGEARAIADAAIEMGIINVGDLRK